MMVSEKTTSTFNIEKVLFLNREMESFYGNYYDDYFMAGGMFFNVLIGRCFLKLSLVFVYSCHFLLCLPDHSLNV